TTELRDVNIENSLKVAYAKRVDYNSALIAQENAGMEMGISRNAGMPSLTVSGSLSSMAMDSSNGDSLSNASTFESPAYGVRVKMSYPLGDSGTEVKIRDAKYKVQQSNLMLEKVRREVKDDVVTKAEMIKVVHTSYQKARVAREESEKYYNSIQRNLRMGKIPSSVVKNALDAMNDSRQRELEALVQYNIVLLQMDLATNELLEKYNVNINQYLSEVK
ncbi:MAG: TolC family protein, partial [Spirochaetota bacterium]